MKPGIVILAVIAMGAASAVQADSEHDYEHKPEAQDFIHGAPETPSEAWTLAAGGRIYDNWWEALDRAAPEGDNPAYPVNVNEKQRGASTWRCKECHGWDYLGAEGIYAADSPHKGGHFTGVAGIMNAAGRPVPEIMTILRDANHPYTEEMIRDDEMARVAAFVSRGLHDMRAFINFETRQIAAGDVNRGREIFQTICAACHGFDGRLLDWGVDGQHNYIGTEAASLPDEVFNKVMNAHPGVQMANLRALPLSDVVSLLAYAATLPVGAPAE